MEEEVGWRVTVQPAARFLAKSAHATELLAVSSALGLKRNVNATDHAVATTEETNGGG